MPSLARLSVAAVTTVLASVTVCSGAGVAGAQEPPAAPLTATAQDAPGSTHTSPSALTVSRSSGEPIVSYANRSGRDLFCLTILSTAEVVDAYYDFLRALGPDAGEVDLPVELEAAVEAATQVGRFGYLTFDSAPGSRGPVDPVFAVLPEDESFALEAVSSCRGDDYVEVERTTSGGFLGSLPMGSADLSAGGGEPAGSLALGAIASVGVGVGVGVATGVIPPPAL